MNSFSLKTLCAILSLFLTNSDLFADILIDGYTDTTNDRFTNSSSFILNGLDLSGVGQTNLGPGGLPSNWATAISRNVVLSAYHARPNINETIHFYPGNDPSVSSVQRHVVSGIKIGGANGTDLYLGLLNRELDDSIRAYDFAQEPLDGSPPANGNAFLELAGRYQGLNAYVFGTSPFDEDSNLLDARTNFNDLAVGRNKISGYSENFPFNSNQDNDVLILYHENDGDADFVPFEARVRGGDSGAPLLVDIDGDLKLLGTNGFLLSGDAGFGVNYTGNQAAAINNFISVNSVPEPSSVSIMILALMGVGSRRKRCMLSPKLFQTQ